MKVKILYLILAALLLTAQAALAGAEALSLGWWTADNGGGVSTGSPYSLSGTIGQPDAGALAGGDYAVSGGFWGGLAAAPPPGVKVYLPVLNK